MVSDRKFLRATWISRLSLLLGILALLYSGYLYTFVSPNMLKSYGSFTIALSMGMFFFSSFPGHRMNIRYNQLKYKLSERTDFDDTLPSEVSLAKEVKFVIRYTTLLVILFILVTFNILLAVKAYSNGNHPRMFLHMVIIIAAFFIFNASLLVYSVDVTFKKLDGLISQLKKEN